MTEVLHVDAGPASASVVPPPTAGAGPARRRGKDRKRRKVYTPVTDRAMSDIALLRAQGFSERQIGRTLNIAGGHVGNLLRTGLLDDRIKAFRDLLRNDALERSVEIQAEAYDWLSTVVKKKEEPKTFDMLTRGLQAIERTASSASGEARRVEVASKNVHVVDGDVKLNLREALTQLGVVVEAG